MVRKHKKLRATAREALSNNKAIRKLIFKLANIRRDTEDFGAAVAVLQQAFQKRTRHVKKEFLPAMLEALTDKEVKGVLEDIEAAMAEVGEAHRVEAGERRAKANCDRTLFEASQRTRDEARHAEARQRRPVAPQAQEVAQHTTAAQDRLGVSATARMWSFAAEHVSDTFSAIPQKNLELATHAAANLQALVQTGVAFVSSMHEISASYFDASVKRLVPPKPHPHRETHG